MGKSFNVKSTTVGVEGLPELRRAFKKMGQRAPDLKPLHASLGEKVADRARQLVPIGSDEGGHLQDFIRSRPTKARARVSAGGRGIDPYAGPIHFGWRDRNIEPQPFMFDAIADERDTIISEYQDYVGDLVRKFDREAPD